VDLLFAKKECLSSLSETIRQHTAQGKAIKTQLSQRPYLLHPIELVNKENISCIVDIAAEQGNYGRHLRELGYRGRILSFAPNSQSLETLQQNSKNDPLWQWDLLQDIEHSRFDALFAEPLFVRLGTNAFETAFEMAKKRLRRIAYVQMEIPFLQLPEQTTPFLDHLQFMQSQGYVPIGIEAAPQPRNILVLQTVRFIFGVR
jgi:hypothetical protein